MQGLLLEDNDGNVKLGELEIPAIDATQVLVKVLYAGICGTDMKLYTGHYPVKEECFPLALGHELVGEVVQTGADVTHVAVGDRIVSIATYDSCGACTYCAEGHFNLCRTRRRLGFDVHGAFAEYVRLNKKQVYRVPDTISTEAAALMEPLTVAVRGVSRAHIRPCDKVLVTGPGTIGLLTGLVASQYGAEVVLKGVPGDEERLAIGQRMGIAHVTTESAAIAVDSFDAVFECSGHAGGVSDGIAALRPQGQYVQIGTSKAPLTLPFMEIVYKELRMTGSLGAVEADWQRAIELMERIQTEALLIIQTVKPIAEYEAAFTASFSRGVPPKVLLRP
jgi:L-iditol 2-dehydrogenase